MIMNPTKQYFALVKVLLKINFNIGALRASLKRKISIKAIGSSMR
jgi:hypothetical protein